MRIFQKSKQVLFSEGECNSVYHNLHIIRPYPKYFCIKDDNKISGGCKVNFRLKENTFYKL